MEEFFSRSEVTRKLWGLRRGYMERLNPANIAKEVQKEIVTKKVSDSKTEILVIRQINAFFHSRILNSLKAPFLFQ